MRRRLATIFMIAALVFTSGTFDLFAAGAENETAANSVDAAAVEEQAVEAESEPAAAAESTDAAVESGTVDGGTVEEGAVEEGAVEEGLVEETDPEAIEAEGTEGTAEGETEAVSITALENVAAATEGTKVTLSWTFKEGESLKEGETLTIKYLENGAEKAVENVAASPVEITDLAVNTDYTFDIYFGEAKVGTASATTGLAEITNFEVLRSYKTVYLNWEPVEGAAAYSANWVSINGGHSEESKKFKKPEWAHKDVKVYDIVNCKNKTVGDLKGRDRFTYTVTAYDADGNVIARGQTKGDNIKTLYYKITFKSKVTLKSHPGNYKTTFKKGQVIYAKGFSNGKYYFDYKCKDGKVRTYTPMKIRVTAKISKHISAVKNKKKRGTGKFVYSSEEAERYVNERGITSQTKYMVWVNLYTQREYVFYSKSKGKKRDWKVKKINGVSISSGSATKPTAAGQWKIVRKMSSQHGVPMWNVTKFFSIHGKSSSMPDPGWPESGACVRNTNKNIKWIYNTLPKYTRVVIH